MKKGAALLLAVPKDDDEDEDDGAESGAEECKTLLGNAFDALDDGDREGFVRSMLAAMKRGG